jgi:hypothetical protein
LQGVTSKRGEGAKFWVELSYPIATAEEIAQSRQVNVLADPAFATMLSTVLKVDLLEDAILPADYPVPLHDNPTLKAPQPYPPPGLVVHRPLLPAFGLSMASTASSQLADPFTALVVDDDPMTRTLLSR